MKPIILFRDELFEGKENYCSLTDVVRCTVASNAMQLKQCNGITLTFFFLNINNVLQRESKIHRTL